MNSENKYLNILRKINVEYRDYFYIFTKNSFKNWNNKTYNDINYFLENNFKIINDTLNKNLKIFYLSRPEIWIIFLKDKYFLQYIESIWENLLELKDTDFEDQNDFKNFQIITNILNKKDKDSFYLI